MNFRQIGRIASALVFRSNLFWEGVANLSTSELKTIKRLLELLKAAAETTATEWDDRVADAAYFAFVEVCGAGEDDPGPLKDDDGVFRTVARAAVGLAVDATGFDEFFGRLESGDKVVVMSALELMCAAAQLTKAPWDDAFAEGLLVKLSEVRKLAEGDDFEAPSDTAVGPADGCGVPI